MPTLAASLNVNSTAADSSTLTTSSFTPAVGDIIVVKGAKENSTGSVMGVPTDTQGNTYTERNTTGGNTPLWIWTAVAASAASMTVSVTAPGAGMWHSMTVEDWRSADLDTFPAINSTKSGTGFPSTTLTTSQSNSVVTWVNGDFAAVSPTSRVYNSTSASPVEDGIHDQSATGAYVAYYAYQTTGSAGSQTFGMTSPSGQTWSMIGVEVLDVPGPAAPEDPNQTEPLILWQ